MKKFFYRLSNMFSDPSLWLYFSLFYMGISIVFSFTFFCYDLSYVFYRVFSCISFFFFYVSVRLNLFDSLDTILD